MSNEKKVAAPESGREPEAGTVTLSVAELAEYEADRGRVLELATKVAELEAREARRDSDQAKAALDADIAELSRAGKLPPSLHEWARGQSRAELSAWAAVAPTYVAPRAETPGESVALSDEDKRVARLMGVPIEKFINARQAETKAGGVE